MWFPKFIPPKLLGSLELPPPFWALHTDIQPMTCCWIEFQGNAEAMMHKESLVLFIEACYAIDQSDSLIGFKLGQSDSFEHTDPPTDRQTDFPFLYI